MTSLLSLPTGRVGRRVIVLVWVVAIFLTLAFNLPGKFADAEDNESSSFLPGDAESTLALQETEQLTDGEQAGIVIAYRREGGLTEADQERISADVELLNAEVEGTSEPFAVAETSEDGSATLVLSSITATGEAEDILDPVKAIRDRVSDPGGGLEVKVTGAAGFSADAIEIFEQINGTLLGAAFLLVFVLLILIYRSPILLWVPLIAVGLAELMTRAIGFGLTEAGVTVNGQSSAILSILVLGAGTNYALLLIARYREELREHESRAEAMSLALRSAGPAILAAGGTVIAALLCLSLADVNSTASLGPIGAIGIATAMLVMLTFLPALLVIAPRLVFWPRVPRVGDTGTDTTHGVFRRVGEWVSRAPRRVWIGSVAALGVMALGGFAYTDGLTSGNSFRGEVESVDGQELITLSFPSGANAPTEVFVPDPGRAEDVASSVAAVPGVAFAEPIARGSSGVLVSAVLEPDPYSTEAFDLVPDIRAAAKDAGGEEVLVGGATAVERDIREATERDLKLIIPLVLLVVLLILIAVLRAFAAPVILALTVILSFFAAFGVGIVVSDVIFGFPGADPSLPLFAFVFLVALGIDYNIFLMARVREETLEHGTRQGMLRGLAVTGGVITSAGIVLAGVFAVLGVLPLVFLTQLGFTVAFGVLLDTFLVRSILVPALVLDIGPRVWWPSALAREGRRQRPPASGRDEPAPAARAP